ncbi:hypothetical protein LCGC14_2517020 [marine sediment metagenome]|uniref:Uncharacterized protein n=1 Tax=marine sediment metagenome TaxID=412755 RepID=A0A0F9D957_9ZZZZ
MGNITAVRNEENIKQSLYYYLNNETYSGAGLGTTFSSKTLKQHYTDPQVNIVVGFPDALQDVQIPTIALVTNSAGPVVDLAYNRQIQQISYSFSLYGFCGGMQSDPMNKLQRGRIKNDVRYMLHFYHFRHSPVDIEATHSRLTHTCT